MTGNQTHDEEVKKIQAVLDQLQPYIQSHGGTIAFKSYEKGVLQLTLHGACESCVLASVTLGSGVEQMVKEQVSGVERVVAVDEAGTEVALEPFDDWREFQ